MNKGKFGLLGEEEPPVVADGVKFKIKLSISDEAYDYLNKAENLIDCFKAIAAGVGTGSFTGVAWYMGLGALAKFSLGIGLLATPVGWFVGAGALGAIAAYSVVKFGKKLDKKAEEKLYVKIPKYIKTPMDVLGLAVISVILPVAVKMAKADENLCEKELGVIRDYFVNGWGFSLDFLNKAIKDQECVLQNFNYSDYHDELLKATELHKEIKYEILVKELLFIQSEVMEADGVSSPEELVEMARLREILNKKFK